MAVVEKSAGALCWLEADNLSVPHGFTTRQGGVSQGPLASLNLGTGRGDSPENVLENYRRLGLALGFDPKQAVLARQTHTDTVLQVDRTHWGAGLYGQALPACDGLITNTPGTALVVFTADCTPILLQDVRTGAVGAVHAGWRGTAARIAAKAVEAMQQAFGSRAEDICAAIGPNIGPCCFQTDGDVPAAMEQAFGAAAGGHIRSAGHKFYVNLKALNALALQQAGVKNITRSQLCTACAPDRFWSHRLVGSSRGSQAGVIVCKEVGK